MYSTRIINRRGEQIVTLPKEYHFDRPEVCITRIGPMLIVSPQTDAWALFKSSIGSVTRDFRRPPQGRQERSCADLDPTRSAGRNRNGARGAGKSARRRK